MVRLTTLLITSAAAITNVEAFVPSSPNQLNHINRVGTSSTTSLNAAPTMVIYWSIKTAIDTIAYGVGLTDEVKGTGVWNAFELKREPKPEEDGEKKDDKSN